MISGSYVALITPFDEFGHVDYKALEHLINWHIEEKTDGIVLCGSTGEGSSLTLDEKIKIFRFGMVASQGRIPIIAGVGGSSTSQCLELTKEAKEAGVDATCSVVPYYTRPTEEGCILHFQAIAEVGLPIIFYHHPGRTGVKLSPRAIADICEIPQVIAVKEASGDLGLALDIMELTDKPLLSGDDAIALAHLGIGFEGSISIVANVVPKLWKEFIATHLKGEHKAAREQFFSLYPFIKSMILETNPQCVKYGVSLFGKCRPDLRAPLLEPSEKNKRIIKQALQDQMSTAAFSTLRS